MPNIAFLYVILKIKKWNYSSWLLNYSIINIQFEIRNNRKTLNSGIWLARFQGNKNSFYEFLNLNSYNYIIDRYEKSVTLSKRLEAFCYFRGFRGR